jgi:transposase
MQIEELEVSTAVTVKFLLNGVRYQAQAMPVPTPDERPHVITISKVKGAVAHRSPGLRTLSTNTPGSNGKGAAKSSSMRLQVGELHDSGMSVHAIAKKLLLSLPTVYRYRREFLKCKPTESDQRTVSSLTNPETRKIVDMYEAGGSIVDIGKKLKLSYFTISGRLRALRRKNLLSRKPRGKAGWVTGKNRVEAYELGEVPASAVEGVNK